jgi:hypothetical protein
MLTYPQNLEGSITIIGEKGTARVGGVAVNQIQHWAFAEPDRTMRWSDAALDRVGRLRPSCVLRE